MTEKLLDAKELAEVLNLPVSWIYGQTRRKDGDIIPMVRAGKYVRFDKGAVLEWLGRTGGKNGR